MPAFVLALVIAASMGLFNGVIQVRTGIHSFVVTLGTSLVYRGVLIAGTGGFPRVVSIPSDLSTVVSGAILPGGFRMSSIWLLIVVLLATFLLLRTRLGNWIQAIG